MFFFTAKSTSSSSDTVDRSTVLIANTTPLVSSAISKLALCLPGLDTAVAAISSYLDGSTSPSTHNASQRSCLKPIITTDKAQIYSSPRGPNSFLGLWSKNAPTRRMTAPLAPPIISPTSPSRDNQCEFIIPKLNTGQTYTCMAFKPLSPIPESPEPNSVILPPPSVSSSPPPSSSFSPTANPSPVLISPASDAGTDHFGLVIPMAPSTECISYFAHLDSTSSMTSFDSERTLQEDLLAYPASSSLPQSQSTSLSLPPSLHFSTSASTESAPTRLATPMGFSRSNQQYLHVDDGLNLSNSYFSQQAWDSVYATVCNKDQDKSAPAFLPMPLPLTSSNFLSSLSTAPSLTSATSAPFVFDPFGCDDNTTTSTSFEPEHVGVGMVNSLLDLDNTTSIKHTLTDFVFEPIGLPDVNSTPEAYSHMGDLVADDSVVYAPMDLFPEITDYADIGPDPQKCAVFWADPDDDELDDIEDATPTPPTVLTHDGISYTITGEIGCGTYGQVVFARTSLGEEVAIKITSKIATDSRNPETLRRFILNERNILIRIAQQKSPFLTKPLACFQDDDNVYFVMRMYPQNLAQVIRKSNLNNCPLPLAQIKSFAADLILGLEALHSMHIVHRDLKPDNILISPNGHLAIADFGFAKQCSKDQWANGRVSGTMGTPGYLAPEILFPHFATGGCTYAIDTWGFGMILLELLLGEPYIQGGSVVQREYRNRLAPFVVSHDIDRRVRDRAAADLLKLVLKRDAAKRPTWAQIRAHRFFSDVDWKAVKARKPTSHIAKPTLDRPDVYRPQPESQEGERVSIKHTLLDFECSDEARFDFRHGRTIFWS